MPTPNNAEEVTSGHVIKETVVNWPRRRGRQSSVHTEKVSPQSANLCALLEDFRYFLSFCSLYMIVNGFLSISKFNAFYLCN